MEDGDVVYIWVQVGTVQYNKHKVQIWSLAIASFFLIKIYGSWGLFTLQTKGHGHWILKSYFGSFYWDGELKPMIISWNIS